MWTVYYGGVHYPCTDVNVNKQLDGLNYAIVKINLGTISNDTLIELYKDGTKEMTGYVKRVIDPMDDTTKYMVTERAVELKDYLCDDGSLTYEVTYTSMSVDDIMADILSGTGWTFDDRSSGYGVQTINNMKLYYASKIDAIFKMLRIHLNAKVWFDSDSRTVYCDDSRVDHGVVTYNLKTPDTTSAGRNVTKVIVLGYTDEVRGEAGTGTKIQVYRYGDCESQSEAETIAATILSEINGEKARIELQMPPTTNYDEGDIVNVDGVDYQIFDVKIAYDKTTLGIGSPEESIFDKYSGQISRVSGIISIDDTHLAKLNGSNVFTGGTNEFLLVQAVQYGGVSGNHLVIKGPVDQEMRFQPGGYETPVFVMHSNGFLATAVSGGSGGISFDGGDTTSSEMCIKKSGTSTMKLQVPQNGIIEIQVG